MKSFVMIKLGDSCRAVDLIFKRRSMIRQIFCLGFSLPLQVKYFILKRSFTPLEDNSGIIF